MKSKKIPEVLTLLEPEGEAVPVVFDSPHSGTDYPDDFGYAVPFDVIRTGEDSYVDELYAAAPKLGAPLLLAHFPRIYIDANRAVEDMDVSLLDGEWPLPVTPGVKTQSGIGLIWRLGRGGVPIYERKLSVAEARRRIDVYHAPYHEALQEVVDELHGRFGTVWHINCHSMPALSDERSPEGPGKERPDFCLGDRDGTTCAPEFTAFVKEVLDGMGYKVTVNDPYKGVELVRRHGDPAHGRHSLQIEVNRRLYMDEDRFDRIDGFSALEASITRLVEAICGFARERIG